MERKRFLTHLTQSKHEGNLTVIMAIFVIFLVEEHTKVLIAQLLDMNAKAKKTESLLEQEERARQLEQGLFKVKMDEYETLRKKEVERK